MERAQIHQRSAASSGKIAAEVSAVESPVLVAVDLSPVSESALAWACHYAKALGAPADAPGTYKSKNGDSLEPMSDVAQSMLVEFLARTSRDRADLADLGTAKTLCVCGLPASTILQTAATRGVQHIVLGSRSRTSFERLFHGSTVTQVARDSQIPVTIIKADG